VLEIRIGKVLFRRAKMVKTVGSIYIYVLVRSDGWGISKGESYILRSVVEDVEREHAEEL
jgi:hypothetical protein